MYLDINIKPPKSVQMVKFGCSNCGRRWESANGSLIDYQICKNCYTECYPSDFKIKTSNKYGNMNKETYLKHNQDLCGKCNRLGFSCMELSDIEKEQNVVIDEDGKLKSTEKQLSDFIVVKSKNKNRKKKNKVRLI